MKLFIVTFTIAFCFLVVGAVIINICKRRQARTSHGLTGLCHKTGDTMCCSCSAALLNTPADPRSCQTGSLQE